MYINNSHSIEVGQIFTPIKWAEWLVERWGIFDAWIDGASICDPTAGQGAFALALFRLARSRGVPVSPELLSRLTLIEVRASHLQAFQHKARRKFAIDFPTTQLLALDVITDPPNTEYDILFGNPPWANFTDLSDSYKERLKPYFLTEGLVPDKKQVLLGSSRTDIAALVLKIVLGNLLRKNGIGCFFLPLSLFSGDAHRGFRDYVASGRRFAVDEVCEFTATEVFGGVGTSYCCARFRMDVLHKFPIRYFREREGGWIEHRAVPLKASDDQWRVLQRGDTTDLSAIKVELSSDQKPRQGVNTCGTNAIFMFEDKPGYLPEEFLFPLATKEIWKNEDLAPHKWILLPYNRNTGRPLSWASIERYAELRQYLIEVRGKLEGRRGTLIRSAIAKGVWWSLLGVGPYSFAPYKVIWEAYGKSDFHPVILNSEDGQMWQANQAMQAFIPCRNEGDAERVCAALQHPGIPILLRQLNGEGKCNWAQPGKIRKILSF
ncbi:MAG: hypothetical protein F4Y79_18960 [Gemmatimonadetes bacterium]|nr:hypothetical protein [Gemmatimonadota bacterium]